MRDKGRVEGQCQRSGDKNNYYHHVLHVSHLGHFLYYVPREGHLALRNVIVFLSILYKWANATGAEEGRR